MKYIHSIFKHGKGGMTVGYVLDADSQRAAVTLAQCSLSDNYSKPKGRMICENRYEHGTGFLIPVDPKNIHHSILEGARKVLK